MLTIPLEQKLWARRMYTDPDIVLGERSVPSINGRELTWYLEGNISNSRVDTRIGFADTYAMTQRILAEVLFDSKLHEVYQLKLKSLAIVFRPESTSKYERTRHLIQVKGHGYHSYVDHEPSDFTYESYTSEVMTQMINTIVEIATKAR